MACGDTDEKVRIFDPVAGGEALLVLDVDADALEVFADPTTGAQRLAGGGEQRQSDDARPVVQRGTMSGEDAAKPTAADPDFDPALEEKNMTKEAQARSIRADRNAENPEQSLLDALEDYMILCGGENVYCVEVESVLARHPAVGQAAVFGLPNDLMGEMVTLSLIHI